MNAFQTIDENLYSNEELLGNTLKDHQKETGNAGFAFAKAAQETADTIKREGQAQIDKLTAQQKEKEVGSEAYNALQQAIDKIRTDMNSNAADVLAQAKQAVGYLSDSDWLNRVENLQSKRDNIQDIREAFINKEDLTVEQTQRLWNEIIPDLQKLDPSLGYAELKKIFDEQGLEAVGLLSKYLDDFKENSNLIALNSVGSDLADVDYALQQLTSAGKDLSS
jgi:CRISPR/Cas system CSM-associated protein Csm2 small subunit